MIGQENVMIHIFCFLPCLLAGSRPDKADATAANATKVAPESDLSMLGIITQERNPLVDWSKNSNPSNILLEIHWFKNSGPLEYSNSCDWLKTFDDCGSCRRFHWLQKSKAHNTHYYYC
jgi:hypothetical protein